MARQSLSDTVAGDQGTDSPLETEIGARVTSSPSPPSTGTVDQSADSPLSGACRPRTPKKWSARPVHRGFQSGRVVEAELREIDLVQVCHTHEGLASNSEVVVIEHLCTGVKDPCMARVERLCAGG